MEDYRYEDNYSGSVDPAARPKKKRHVGRTLLIVLASLILTAVIGAFVYIGIRYVNTLKNGGEPDKNIADAEIAPSEIEAVQEAAKEEKKTASLTHGDIGTTDLSGTVVAYDVSEIVEKLMPSVVAITDNLEVSTRSNPYNFYFGGRSSYEPSTKETSASGSGVIISQNEDELLIVTNNHVVDNEGNYTSYSVASKGLTVAFSDGSTADAVVKGTDSELDLAVISVSLKDLTQETKDTIRIALIGSSDDIKVGSGVIAIGNALGYGQSVTTGIVSAKDREVTVEDNTRYLLQTDAAINPGNSGGGLFNMQGELIGINCAKYEDTAVEGIGFAIPVSSTEDIIEDLMNKTVIAEEDQGYIGINGETVPATYINNYGYPSGVSVTRIGKGTPAEEAGLQIYDIITKINGKKVATMEALKKQINSYMAGETITLTVMRPEGRSFAELEVEATLVRYADIEALSKE